jgi:hypothetical protein
MADSYIGSSGAFKKMKRRFVAVGGAFKPIKQKYVAFGGSFRPVYQDAVPLLISANTVNFNVLAAYIAAVGQAPTDAVTINVTVASGMLVTSSSTATPAFRTGVLPPGSVVNLFNNGLIIGAGGAGGAGGTSAQRNGIAGSPGGDAIWIESGTLQLNNANGYIFAGGGGGGGGSFGLDGSCGSHNGGGGGGGAGNIPGIGGVGDGNGQAGSSVGGRGGFRFYICGDPLEPRDGASSVGGVGGSYAAYGSSGGALQTYLGGVGGNPGRAVVRNGFAYVLLEFTGNNYYQFKGDLI